MKLTPRKRIVLSVLTVALALCARPATEHARAASLLVSFADKDSKPSVSDERVTFGPDHVPARIYRPSGTANAGVVLVHGVHHAGIDEPRLERFARAVAATGIVVMTPAVTELSDYKVAPHSIDTVGAATEDLRAQLGVDKVGLMGMSFGGGISLLTAADPRFAESVSFVVAVGAHDDLARVSSFFLDDRITEPNGETNVLKAHGYGVMVLVYSRVEDFFPAEDVPNAREALRLWLWEQRDDARQVAARMSAPARAKMEHLFDDGAGSMKEEIVQDLARHRADMAAVSPHGHLQSLRANVYLLHGAGDTVIPATETRWLATDVPADRLRTVLVSPAIEHVELKSPSPSDQWALVHFMAQVLSEAR